MLVIPIPPANALDLWAIRVDDAHPAPNMVLNLVKRPGNGFTGCGIYSIAYSCPRDGNKVIYLGSFSGEKIGDSDNALAGDVRERWYKHIGTATLLIKNLRMRSQRLYFEQKESALNFFANAPDFNNALQNSFLDVPTEILNAHVFLRNGLQVSGNRLGFAIQNLTSTNLNNREHLEEIISRFTCFYWQVTSQVPLRKSIIKPILHATETEVIQEFVNKLPMNKEYVALDNRGANYHYNPDNLIAVGSDDFNNFSEIIQERLEHSINNLM
jgi:hypothetical protein